MLSKEDVKKTKQFLEDFEKEFEKYPAVKTIKNKPEIWVDDDGIVHTKVVGDIDEMIKYAEIMMNYSEKYIEKNKNKIVIPIELRILTEIPPILKMPSIKYRKKGAEFLKKTQETIKFNKMAICGGGIIVKTVLAFILRALGMKNIKHFNTEEEALKWLKKD